MNHLGKDVLVTPFFAADEWDTVDLALNPLGVAFRDEPVDLASTTGIDNLRQAIVLRLLTPEGSLKDLGHATYGSRLHEIIGRENVEQARLLARSYIVQALAREPRIEEIINLQIAPSTPDAPHSLRINLWVSPVGGGDPLALGLEIGL